MKGIAEKLKKTWPLVLIVGGFISMGWTANTFLNSKADAEELEDRFRTLNERIDSTDSMVIENRETVHNQIQEAVKELATKRDLEQVDKAVDTTNSFLRVLLIHNGIDPNSIK